MADDSGDLVVETFKLTKIYQNRQIALNDVTLKMEPGCVLGLLGPNGAGKTTFLRLVLGLHRPTAGWVKVFGKFMTPNAAGLRRRIGYIPTNPQFPRGMSPIDYLDYMARLFGLPADVRKPRLASLIRAVDLGTLLTQTVHCPKLFREIVSHHAGSPAWNSLPRKRLRFASLSATR